MLLGRVREGRAAGGDRLGGRLGDDDEGGDDGGSLMSK